MADGQLRHSWQLDAESARALAHAAHDNPFAVLGPHDTPDGRVVRALLPGAAKVEILRRSDDAVLARLESRAEYGLFESLIQDRGLYRLRIFLPDPVAQTQDPYSFALLLAALHLH